MVADVVDDEGFLLANFEVFSPRSENHLCFLVFSQESLRKTLKFARRKNGVFSFLRKSEEWSERGFV